MIIFTFFDTADCQQIDIYIDAGHGGIEGTPDAANGAPTPIPGYYEKDINLSVALKLKAVLDSACYIDSVDYFFTRVNDTGVITVVLLFHKL